MIPWNIEYIIDIYLRIYNLPNILGKTISEVCINEFHNSADNHCAHFVSHIMGYTFGFKCREMTAKGEGIGVNIRVHEIFSKCPSVGEWKDKPVGNCLAFVTASTNVNIATKTMRNMPKKHIGICYNDEIYHYSNTRDKVVKQSPSDFSKHYKGSNIKVFYGTFPVIKA